MGETLPLTVGELFAGIGGIGLGFERVGCKVKWAHELDDYAGAVYRKNFPHVNLIQGDIREWDPTKGGYEVDIITGGFPCQDISQARTKPGRLGISGERSGLWAEFLRLVQALRPHYIVAENSEALRYKDRGLTSVLCDLSECGYDAEWLTIRASAVGLPHHRARLWVVAYTDGETQPTIAQYVQASLLSKSTGTGRAGWEPSPTALRRNDGVPRGMDRLRCLGNAVVPQVAQIVAEAIIAHANFQRLVSR